MRAQRPQDLVFSLFGEYLLDRPGPVWVGSLIELLAPFGLSENAARTVLSRMSRKGWLRAVRRGRLSYYALTARGQRLLQRGAERIYHPPRGAGWDGTWHLVAYSIPEEERELRDRLRVRLSWIGCGSLGGGLWISPRPIREAVEEAARELGVNAYLEIFRAEHLGFSGARRLAARCWDLPSIDARYASFLARFQPRFEKSRVAARRGRLTPESAFVRRFELIHEWRDFPLVDPYLPRELLPARWRGERAARLFDAYHALLTGPADHHVDTVLAAAARRS